MPLSSAVSPCAAHHAGTKSAQAQAAEQDRTSRSPSSKRNRPRPVRAAPTARAAAGAAAAVGGTDMVAQLENLKKLLDEGVLTQAEFDTQKQKLLASS